MADITDNKVLANALLNVSRSDKMEGWAVKCSSNFVNEYVHIDESSACCEGSLEDPNHLLGSFPCLFPFGCGGFEVDIPLMVSYEAHAHWALRYKD